MPTPVDPHRAEEGSWRGDLPRVGARLRELLGEVQERIEDIVGTTRTRMSGLVNAVLAVSSGLEIDATLRRIVQAAINLVDARYGARGAVITEITEGTPVRTTIRMSGPLDVVPAGLAEHAQAVVREAVSNAVRHAAATGLTVTVSVDDDLVIDVTDNGVGIPGTVARSGLHNLRSRAEETGGTFRTELVAGGGTRLVWSAPLP